MKYISTRTLNSEKIESAQAIKQGLANDGGLFVPDSMPSLSDNNIKALCEKSYPERAAYILSQFLTDYTTRSFFPTAARHIVKSPSLAEPLPS